MAKKVSKADAYYYENFRRYKTTDAELTDCWLVFDHYRAQKTAQRKKDKIDAENALPVEDQVRKCLQEAAKQTEAAERFESEPGKEKQAATKRKAADAAMKKAQSLVETVDADQRGNLFDELELACLESGACRNAAAAADEPVEQVAKLAQERDQLNKRVQKLSKEVDRARKVNRRIKSELSNLITKVPDEGLQKQIRSIWKVANTLEEKKSTSSSSDAEVANE